MKVIEVILWIGVMIAVYAYLGHGLMTWLMLKLKRR